MPDEFYTPVCSISCLLLGNNYLLEGGAGGILVLIIGPALAPKGD
jgi:hypothetical protein